MPRKALYHLYIELLVTHWYFQKEIVDAIASKAPHEHSTTTQMCVAYPRPLSASFATVFHVAGARSKPLLN